jgi:predicted DNA-binding WGR domain protein
MDTLMIKWLRRSEGNQGRGHPSRRKHMSKTNKMLADFAELQPIQKVTLEIFDPKANHNKFWRCYLYLEVASSTYYVVRHWGRNGSKGQEMAESFYSNYSARDSYDKLVNEKERKGYKPEASPLDKIVREV